MLLTNDSDRLSRLLAERDCAGARETWQHLCRDAKERGVRVELAQIKKTYKYPAWEITVDRFEATYATRNGRPLPLTGLFGESGKLELYLYDERVPGLFATLYQDTQTAWLERVFGNGRELLGEAHALRRPFTLPLDWTGEVEVRGLFHGPEGEIMWADDAGETPTFHGVYARRGWGGVGHVADFDCEADARCFAYCLQAMHRTGIAAADLWDRPQEGAPTALPCQNWGEAWGQAEYEAARDEGWGLRMCDGAVAIVPLPSESSAAAVEAKATEGSPLHLKAMFYVLSHAMHDQYGSRFLQEDAFTVTPESTDAEDLPAPTP